MTVKYSFRFHPISIVRKVDAIQVHHKHFQLFKLFSKCVDYLYKIQAIFKEY